MSSAKFCVALVDTNQMAGFFFNIQNFLLFPLNLKNGTRRTSFTLWNVWILSNQRESVNPGALFKCSSLAEIKFFDNYHRWVGGHSCLAVSSAVFWLSLSEKTDSIYLHLIPSGVQNNPGTTSAIWDFITCTAHKFAAWVFYHHSRLSIELISILKLLFLLQMIIIFLAGL